LFLPMLFQQRPQAIRGIFGFCLGRGVGLWLDFCGLCGLFFRLFFGLDLGGFWGGGFF
jgi:hypothetical protein